MIKLAEILDSVKEEQKSGLVPLDDWKLTELDYLFDIGFSVDDDYVLMINTNPKLSVRKKKSITHELPNGKRVNGEGYILTDKTKHEEHIFPTFTKMIEFFDEYEQDFKI